MFASRDNVSSLCFVTSSPDALVLFCQYLWICVVFSVVRDFQGRQSHDCQMLLLWELLFTECSQMRASWVFFFFFTCLQFTLFAGAMGTCSLLKHSGKRNYCCPSLCFAWPHCVCVCCHEPCLEAGCLKYLFLCTMKWQCRLLRAILDVFFFFSLYSGHNGCYTKEYVILCPRYLFVVCFLCINMEHYTCL